MEEEPVSAIRFEQVSLQFARPRLAVNDCSCEVEAGQLGDFRSIRLRQNDAAQDGQSLV